jgi:site-specific DNA-methyltransferase (adenine-specific)
MIEERVDARGEVFTPLSLVNEMLDKLPVSVWDDPTKTFIDNSAGNGNFLIEVKNRLLAKGYSEVNILEDQIFAVEINIDSILELQERLGYTINGIPNPILNIKNFIE